jgi:ketosteroid isomerase-like protein
VKIRDFESLAKAFLTAYERKDIAIVGQMLANEVVVRDWNQEVLGKEAAIAEFTKNFEAANSLSIEVLRTFSSSDGTAVELEIVVDETENLRVIDVFSFNKLNQIDSIISYRGL